MRTRHFPSLGLIFALLLSLLPVRRVEAATLTVNTTLDVSDGSCSDGTCSLRDAILIANTNPGPDTIEFNIPEDDCGFWACIIYPTNANGSFWLTGDGTTINGYTQPGASRADASNTAVIKIEIEGSFLVTCTNLLDCNGLIITSSNNVVEGLSIYNFAHNAIAIGSSTATSAENNVIKGNYLGVRSYGTSAPGNGWDGVFIGFNAENNTVGGNAPAQRNIISRNNVGVEIWPSSAAYSAFNNVIKGNYIGSDHNGTAGLPNVLDGVRIYGGAQVNTVGGNTEGERNVIVGNGRSGVRITGLGTNKNIVAGNYIGVDKSGLTDLANHSEGVYIGLQAQLNLVGGDTLAERNYISGNVDSGVMISGTNTMSNTVSGNFIGLSTGGIGVLGNSGSGVYIFSASHNQIGGDTEYERNYICGNYNGITLYGADAHENVIIGNYIGTNETGFLAASNIHSGVVLGPGAHDNRIGGGAGEGNVISGNAHDGVELNTSTTENVILGNYIGTDYTGHVDLGNGSVGVELITAANNTIGGETLEEYNVISGNGGNGVKITDGAHENTVSGNIIGLTADLESAIPNNSSGISLSSSAHDNLIGGSITGLPLNYICANIGNGVDLNGANTTQNEISGNVIGMVGFGNNGAGISLDGGAHNNPIGGGEQRANQISYNHQYGIAIFGDGVDGNVITDSVIDHNILGGVMISEGANNRVGPRNTILGNNSDGIWIIHSGAIGNQITENGIRGNSSMGIHLEDGANGAILPPEITAQGMTTVSGTACANCTIELFASGDMGGEGWVYINKTAATAGGAFSIPITFLPYPYLTATATDATDGTSEFSEVFTSIYQYILLPIIIR